MKTCSRCKQQKNNAEFSLHKRMKDGLSPYCIPCHKEYSREHYLKNREKYLEGQRVRREENPEYMKEWNRNNRDKKADNAQRREAVKRIQKGKPYSRLDIFQRDQWVCHICQEAIDPYLRRPDLMSASIDHVKPLAKGGLDCYDNVAAAHLRCNVKKGDTYGEEERQGQGPVQKLAVDGGPDRSLSV